MNVNEIADMIINFEIDHTFPLERFDAKHWIRSDEHKAVAIVCRFLVSRGCVGFLIRPDDWISGEARIFDSMSNFLLACSGIAQSKVYDIQEMSFEKKSRLYIEGALLLRRSALLRIRPTEKTKTIIVQNEAFPALSYVVDEQSGDRVARVALSNVTIL